MRVLRILRGIIGTAVTFAVPWAIAGGALAVGVELVWPSVPGEVQTPQLLLWFARTGGMLFGALGIAVGAAFATALAVTGRRLRFEQVTAPRVLGLGVAGGAVVSGALLGTFALLSGAWPLPYSIGLGISAFLGGGSALAMFQIARRGRSVSSPAELAEGTGRAFEESLAREAVRRGTT